MKNLNILKNIAIKKAALSKDIDIRSIGYKYFIFDSTFHTRIPFSRNITNLPSIANKLATSNGISYSSLDY